MEKQDYIRGFNSGYSIQQRAPEILKAMLSGMQKETQYKIGLRDGGQQLEKEKRLAHIVDRSKSQNKENQIDR